MFFFLLVSCALVANTIADNPCDEGWEYYEPESKCLYYESNAPSATFQLANALCAILEAEMAKIESEDKNAFISHIMGDDDAEILWLPMTHTGDTFFHYSDDTLLGSYQPWIANIPIYYADDSYICANRVTSFSNGVANYLWKNADCSSENRYVCEKNGPEPTPPPSPTTTTTTTPPPPPPSTPTCGNGWYLHPADVACVKVVKKGRKSFSDAESDCVQRGGHLITSITTRDQIDHVMDHINYRGHFWIGIKSLGEDGTFTNLDGTPLTGNAFKKGRPRNNGLKHCVSLKMGRWYDKKCHRPFAYICQKDPTIVALPAK